MSIQSIVRIASKELRYIAYSPIGWIVLAIFFVQSAYQFSLVFESNFQRLALGSGPDSFAEILFTSGFRSVFHEVIFDVYLYIPLITMAVFSREMQSGSIKLFMSSPVRPAELVVGKFIGVCTYLAFFVFSLAVLVLVAVVWVPNFDWLATLPGLIGVYLLIGSYAAVGIFVSSLTKHQVVAAIVTLAILFLLQSMANWLQTTPIFNEITNWASLAGRAGRFRSGLIASPDVAYFVILTIAFLSFTTLRVVVFRSGESLTLIGLKSALVAGVAVVVGWVFSQPALSAFIDTTYDRRNSLAPETVELMERLEGPWEIVTYANFIDRMGSVAWPRNAIEDRERYTYYRHINPDLRMTYQLYYDIDGAKEAFRRPQDGRTDEEIIGEYAKRIGLDTERVRSGPEMDALTSVDLASEGYRSIRVLRWNGREELLRHFYDPLRFAAERERAAAIKRLLDGPARVGMVVGQQERSAFLAAPRDYENRLTRKSYRFALINHGFDIVEFDLRDGVPESFGIIVIADPRAEYDDELLSHYREYVRSGRDLVILIEPDSPTSVGVLLKELGLAIGERVTQSTDHRFPPNFLLAHAEFGVLDAYWGESNLDLPVALDGAVSLQPLEDDKGFARHALLRFGDAIMAYGLERMVGSERQRIVVFGDADVFSTANAERRSPITNTATSTDVFHWLTNRAYPVQRTRRELTDNDVRIGLATMRTMQWILICGVPLVILSAGGLLLLARGRR